MNLFPIVVQPSPQLAQLIAQALSAQMRADLQANLKEEFQTMSATLAEAVKALNEVEATLKSKVEAMIAQHAADQAAIADLQAKLEAATAGDPAVVSAIDGTTSSLALLADELPAPPAPAIVQDAAAQPGA